MSTFTFVAKWGQQVEEGGFTLMPNHLVLLNEFLPEERKFTPTEFFVLIQLIALWWRTDNFPFPAKEVLARRTGLSPRQVQRAVAALEKKGFVRRVRSLRRTSNRYDLSGLVEAVREFAQKKPRAFKSADSQSAAEEAGDNVKEASKTIFPE